MSNKTLSAFDVSNYIISKFNDREIEEKVIEKITHLKLQKFLYLCQAFSLAETQKPMFKEKIYAWKYGPVVVEVYKKFNQQGKDPIVSNIAEGDESLIDKTNKRIIDEVLNIFDGYSTYQLMEITHSHDPWRKLKNRIKNKKKGNGDEITNNSMIKYYSPILV